VRGGYYYSYGSRGFGLPEAVKYLLIWNGIFFVLQHFILANGLAFLGGMRIELLLGTVPWLIWHKGYVWQFVTYMFLHGGLFHLLFNMLALWMFGVELERMWGSRKFLQYYFFTGAGAGLTTAALTPNSPIPTIGASGAIYGILLAYAYYFPERRVLFYFLIPIPVRVFVIIIGSIAFINSIGQSGGTIAHVAHLGGLLFGWVYLRIQSGGSFFGDGETRRRRRRPHLEVIDFDDDRRWP